MNQLILILAILSTMFMVRNSFNAEHFKQKYIQLKSDVKFSKAITIEEWVYRCNKVLSNVGSEPLRKEQ